MSDVLLDRLPSLLAVGWRSGPQHRVRILGVCGHVCHIRPTHILIKTVHSVLEVGRVFLISHGRLVAPERARFLAAKLVVLEGGLALNERANAAAEQGPVQLAFVIGGTQILLVPYLVHLFYLGKPFVLQARVFLHGVSHPF